MLIVFYVLLVWLKVVIGISLVFLWLWLVRDRGYTGTKAVLNYVGALAFWVAPWVVFLWFEADLYQGHCGLRQGVHPCGLGEFLWGRMRWLRLGILLDVSLLIGVFLIMLRARASSGEDSRAFRPNGPRAASP